MTMTTPTPPVGSCRTRSATIPTCVASWNFCMAFLPTSTTVPPSHGPSCFSFGRRISNVGWALPRMGIRTTISATQSNTGLSTVAHQIWKPSSGPSPTACPTDTSHGVTIRATLHALHLSMISSRRSRNLKYVGKGDHLKRSEPSVPKNLKKQYPFFDPSRVLIASTSIQWCVFGNTTSLVGLTMLPTSN